MSYQRGITCQISAFQVPDPPSNANSPKRKWLAIATVHIYDSDIDVPGLEHGQAALVGETMRAIDGRAAGDTEAQAMEAALRAVLFQLTAKGYSSNDDVKLW